ncbi:hypothetical protein C8R45DRAFT_484901 [Mycena sanguinolenta]|nr:hypothetical protein C8R45DRAFT_484901 [Mycena sanguinolenta]
MQYTFGVLLEGYNNVLKLYKARSDYRGQMGDHSKRGSHCPVTTTPQPPHMVQSHTRESSIGWANAAKLGWESAQYFHRAYTEDSETAALKGLAKLYESIRAWPEISAVVDRSTGDLLPPSIQTNLAAFGQRYRGTRKVDPELNWTPSEAMEDVAFDFETPREKAVETFWDMSGLKAVHRERWDAAHPNSDSFEVLSQLSSIIDNKYLHDSVQTILEGVFGQIFMRTLVESRGIDLWDV